MRTLMDVKAVLTKHPRQPSSIERLYNFTNNNIHKKVVNNVIDNHLMCLMGTERIRPLGPRIKSSLPYPT